MSDDDKHGGRRGLPFEQLPMRVVSHLGQMPGWESPNDKARTFEAGVRRNANVHSADGFTSTLAYVAGYFTVRPCAPPHAVFDGGSIAT